MRRMLAFVLVTAAVLVAQDGTAPNGYYPYFFHGNTFTGVVVDGPSDVLTLQYTKKGKTKTFTGRLRQDCQIKKANGELINVKASDVTRGDTVEAYYWVTTTKVNDQKVKEYQIIAISPKVVSGKEIPEENRVVYFCTETGKNWQYRAYNRPNQYHEY